MGIQVDAQTLESGSDRQLRVEVASVIFLVHLIGYTGIAVQPGLLQGEIEGIEPLQLTLVGPVYEQILEIKESRILNDRVGIETSRSRFGITVLVQDIRLEFCNSSQILRRSPHGGKRLGDCSVGKISAPVASRLNKYRALDAETRSIGDGKMRAGINDNGLKSIASKTKVIGERRISPFVTTYDSQTTRIKFKGSIRIIRDVSARAFVVGAASLPRIMRRLGSALRTWKEPVTHQILRR